MDKKKIKILSVEDDEFMRIFLKDVFWIHGGDDAFDFSMAKNIEEARESVRKNTPDIIFLDMALPAKEGDTPSAQNGLGFLEEVRANPKLEKVKVFVFSGYVDPDIKKLALKKGADLFMVKGEYLPKELYAAVIKYTGKPKNL